MITGGRRAAVPPADLSAYLDVERRRLGGLEELAHATGLNALTLARLILAERCWHGAITIARNYLASQAVTP